MYRARKRRSIPMLLPHSGADSRSGNVLRGCSRAPSPRRRRRRRPRPGSAASRPDFVCIVRTKSSMRASVGFVLVHDELDPVVERLQVGVGDDARDLDDHVASRRRDRSSRGRSRPSGRPLSSDPTRQLHATGSPSIDSAAGDQLHPSSGDPTPNSLRDEQRGAVHGRARHRDVRRARATGRSTSRSGSGTRSCASSACGSRRRTPTCSTRLTASPWAKWFTGGTHEPRAHVRRPTRRRSRRARRSSRSSGKARTATVRTLTWTELRDAHRPHRGRARRTRRRRRRRGRAVPADGARDGRRAVRGREARRDLPADLLRLRRRRGRGPARGRGRGRARHRRRLHAARQASCR